MYLGIETSTPVCSVALFDEEGAKHVLDYRVDKSHSSRLTIQIQEIMHLSGLKLSELSGIWFSDGPGSYTGLRIGASVAKGLAFVHNLPLYTRSGLMASASRSFKTQSQGVHLACSDARREDIYMVLMDADGRVLNEPRLCSLGEDLEAVLGKSTGGPVYVSGEGRHKVLEKMTNMNLVDCGWGHSAENLAYLDTQNADNQNVMLFEPYYMQSPNITQSKKLIG